MSITRYDHALHNRFNMTSADECYYFIEASSNGNDYSSLYSFLSNFKKDIQFKGTPSWYYRNLAISEFARMISTYVNLQGGQVTFIPEATSHPMNDPLFNDRLIETLYQLRNLRSRVNVELALEAKAYIGSSHNGGSRNISVIQNNLQWNGLVNPPSQTIILLDDVLTTGAHFQACKNIILNNTPSGTHVVGFFLALYQ